MSADLTTMVERVLAEHSWKCIMFQQRPVMVCSCGDQLIPFTSSAVATEAHRRAHVAAKVAEALAVASPEDDDRKALARVMDRHIFGPIGPNTLAAADAVLAAGFCRHPEGTTVTEWAVRVPEGDPDYRTAIVRLVRSQTVAEDMVARTPGRVVISRTRTSYADVVTEWQVASDE